jgi:hypothetical protein
VSCELETAAKPSLVYRIARKPDPWNWPELLLAEPSRNRWDDPRGIYSVLYAATTLVGAYVEVLARFRKDLATEAGYAAVVDDDHDPFLPSGTVPSTWPTERIIGEADLHGNFCDIGAARSLAALRRDMASRLIHFGLSDIDASTISSGNRDLTREISRYVYECSSPEGQRLFAGISYRSRLGAEYVNWALFQNAGYEDSPFINVENRAVSTDDDEFRKAVEILELSIA